jgi:hypothetical protein
VTQNDFTWDDLGPQQIHETCSTSPVERSIGVSRSTSPVERSIGVSQSTSPVER